MDSVNSHSNNGTKVVACKTGHANPCEGNSRNTFSLWNSFLCGIVEANGLVISRTENSRHLETGKSKEIKQGLEFGKEKEFPLGPEISWQITNGHNQHNFPD